MGRNLQEKNLYLQLIYCNFEKCAHKDNSLNPCHPIYILDLPREEDKSGICASLAQKLRALIMQIYLNNE